MQASLDSNNMVVVVSLKSVMTVYTQCLLFCTSGGSFVRAFTQGLNSSLNVPFVHQNTSLSSPSGDTSALFPTASRNPNKAIITIDAQSSRILVANEMTCELFGYQKDELSGMKVQNLFTEPYRTKQQALVEQNIDSSGAPVLISGKVVSMLLYC